MPSSAFDSSPFDARDAEPQELVIAPPIDLQVLLENSMGNSSFAAKLLYEFEQTVHHRMETFQVEWRRNNFQTIRDMAHSFKGVASVLGAARLHRINVAIESACRKTGVAQDSLFEQLQSEVQHVLEAIPRLCTNLNKFAGESA